MASPSPRNSGAVEELLREYPDIPARQRFVEKMLAALKSVSGFERFSISSDIPLNGGGRALYTRPEGDVPPVDKRPACPTHEISIGYFLTWGIAILSGRDIDEHDVEGKQNVILISQAGAGKLFVGFCANEKSPSSYVQAY